MIALRKLAKENLAKGLHRSGIDRAYGFCRKKNDEPLIICYHRVVADFQKAAAHSIPSMLIGSAMFEAQLDWLALRYDLVTLDELRRCPTGTESNKGRPRAAITFDDGYADFYWNAQPILQRKGIPSAIFVVTDLVGTQQMQTHDELYLLLAEALINDEWRGKQGAAASLAGLANEAQSRTALAAALAGLTTPQSMTRAVLGELSHSQVRQFITRLQEKVPVNIEDMAEFQSLSWNMLRELISQGVTVGSHSQSHPLLAEESTDRVATELVQSRRKLERELGVKINHLAYPDGRYNEEVAQLADAAGYEYAYTICNHRSRRYPQLTIPRKVLWEHACVNHLGEFSASILSCQVNGIFDHSVSCPHNHLAPSPLSIRRDDTCAA